MTLAPCLDCGQPTDGPRCPEHTITLTARQSGYDAAWDRLSKRARTLQPFCSVCGTTEDLQTDHTPEAWARKTAGKPIRLKDVDVLCGHHNRQAGAARGHNPRGDTPPQTPSRSRQQAKFQSEIGGGR